ncbi:MAG: hypothetical protein P8170_00900 [Gemmatimonadota bacterium]|jgi:hypothetical protein
MSDNGGNRIRVILRWIQVTDIHEAPGDQEGEFRFRSRVATGDEANELQFPTPPSYWTFRDDPRFNKMDKIDKVLFEGEAGDSLVVELSGEELDLLSPNDQLEPYRKEFTGPVSSWLGRYQPTDEGVGDPENLKDWRICYDVELA